MFLRDSRWYGMCKALDVDDSMIKHYSLMSYFCIAFCRPLNFFRHFIMRIMLISYNMCKDQINMHKVQHMSLSFGCLKEKYI